MMVNFRAIFFVLAFVCLVFSHIKGEIIFSATHELLYNSDIHYQDSLNTDFKAGRYEFTADESVEYALKNASEIINARLNVEIQEALNKEILGYALPDLNLNILNRNLIVVQQTFIPDFNSGIVQLFQDVTDGEGRPLNFPPPAGGGGDNFGAFQLPYNVNAGFTINQLLYEPSVFIALETRRELLQFAKSKYRVDEKQIKQRIIKTYFTIKTTEQKLSLLDSSIQHIEDLLFETQKLYENGFREKLDVDRVRISLSNLKTSRQNAEIGYWTAFLLFKNTIGLSLKDSLVLTESLNKEYITDLGLTIEDFNVDNVAEYQNAKSGLKLQSYDVKRYKLSFFVPTIRFSLGGGYAAFRDQYNFFDFSQRWFPNLNANISINIPIFSIPDYYKLQQAKLKYRQFELQADLLRNTLNIQANSALQSYFAQIDNVETNYDNYELSQNIYQTLKIKYDNGLSTSFELIDASNQVIQAQTNYLQALLDALNSKIDVKNLFEKL